MRELVLVWADDEIQRYLCFVAGPSRRDRWEYDGFLWEKNDEGNWYSWQPAEIPKHRKVPGYILSEDTIMCFGKVREANATAASEIKDALRGQKEVLAHDTDGNERVDYVVDLKNADGTLNKAGKALLDIHARTERIERDATEPLKEELK